MEHEQPRRALAGFKCTHSHSNVTRRRRAKRGAHVLVPPSLVQYSLFMEAVTVLLPMLDSQADIGDEWYKTKSCIQ